MEKSTVTLTTEYGGLSPYSAAIKGRLLHQNPDIILVDISHEVLRDDILAAGYLLHTSMPFFPPGTIHLVGVDVNLNRHPQILIARSGAQYVVSADNGLFSLLFKHQKPEIFALQLDTIPVSPSFPELDLFPYIVGKLASGVPVEQFAKPSEMRTIRETLTPYIENNTIRGSIIFIDGYQNIITDITEKEFAALSGQWSRFQILYRKRSGIKTISTHYDDEKNGETIALFNRSGYLEIAISKGNAKSLLGLQVGGHIIVEFYD